MRNKFYAPSEKGVEVLVYLGDPLVSVVFLNFNGKRNLGSVLVRCLSSVLQSDYPNLEVIFFDNGSTDDSVQSVKQKFQTDDRLRIIGILENCGPTAGYNEAVRHTKGKYIVLLNNDVEVESNSIQELVKVMEKDPTIGMAQSKIMSFDGLYIQNAGNLLDLTLYTLCTGCNEKDKGQYNSVFEPTFPAGACMILRRSMIERIGLFDSNYFIYHDDIDLGLRARLAGFKIFYVPFSVVYHKEGTTRSSSIEMNKMNYYALISRVGLLIKNLEFKSILKNAIPLSVKYAMDLTGLLRNGNAFLCIRALAWSLGNFKNDWKWRQIVQKNIRKISDRELFGYFVDYSVLLFYIKLIFPLRWIFGLQVAHLRKFANLVASEYYRNHTVQLK